MGVSSVIDHAVKAISGSETYRRTVAESLLPLKAKGFSSEHGLSEAGLAFEVPKWVPNGVVAGVDSGFVAKRLATVDIVLIRAVCVAFDYKEGKVCGAKYYPDYFHFPEPHISMGSLEQDEAEQSKSFMRLCEEVRTAKEIIELHSPAYLFVDGSIVPQYQDKPRKESALTGRYSDILSEFESLYAAAEKANCTLIATVEDSRGSRFRQLLQDEVLPSQGNKPVKPPDLDGFFDASLLDYFLSVGERSCAFTYTKSIEQHPVLQDFNSKWSRAIYGLYIKPAPLDRPLRCEFICHGGLREKADEIASVALALSSMHREYAYPSVLIEADLRARLRNDEIELVLNKIMDKLGASVKLRMRRERRPF